MASVEDVDRSVRKLTTYKAAGIDALTTQHMIYSHPILIFKFILLFSAMLKHKFAPFDRWSGVIIPLVKDTSSDIGSSDNYRGMKQSCCIKSF